MVAQIDVFPTLVWERENQLVHNTCLKRQTMLGAGMKRRAGQEKERWGGYEWTSLSMEGFSEGVTIEQDKLDSEFPNLR